MNKYLTKLKCTTTLGESKSISIIDLPPEFIETIIKLVESSNSTKSTGFDPYCIWELKIENLEAD